MCIRDSIETANKYNGGIRMKRLHFNSTLNHKRDGYNTYYVSVEKVVTLYGNEFLKTIPLTIITGSPGIII